MRIEFDSAKELLLSEYFINELLGKRKFWDEYDKAYRLPIAELDIHEDSIVIWLREED